MKTHPKKFRVYIAPFVLVIPLTLIAVMVIRALNQTIEHNQLANLEISLRTTLDSDLHSLKLRGDAAASAPALLSHLQSGDSEAVLATLTAESLSQNIQSLRVISSADLGNSPAGRSLLAGAPNVASIEINPSNNQVALLTLRWIDGTRHELGALLAGQDLDHTYAAQLASEQLHNARPALQLGVYQNSQGLISSSFTDTVTQQTVADFYTSNRINALNETSSITVNGLDYRLDKIPLASLENTNSGLVIFFPIINQLKLIISIFILSLLAAFITDLALSQRK